VTNEKNYLKNIELFDFTDSTTPMTLQQLRTYITNTVDRPLSDIVGSWFINNQDNTKSVLTFLNNGTFFNTEIGAGNASGATGIEYGAYTWDDSKGAIMFIITTDTNGDWGVGNGKTPSIANLTFNVTGNVATAIDAKSNHLTLSRVIGSSNPAIDSWYFDQTTTKGVLTFLNDGTFYNAVYASEGSDNTTGVEFGTYSIDSNTGNVNANVLVDTNGNSGFSTSTATKFITSNYFATASSDNNPDILVLSRVDSLQRFDFDLMAAAAARAAAEEAAIAQRLALLAADALKHTVDTAQYELTHIPLPAPSGYIFPNSPSVSLFNDTGINKTDKITSDPRLKIGNLQPNNFIIFSLNSTDGINGSWYDGGGSILDYWRGSSATYLPYSSSAAYAQVVQYLIHLGMNKIYVKQVDKQGYQSSAVAIEFNYDLTSLVDFASVNDKTLTIKMIAPQVGTVGSPNLYTVTVDGVNDPVTNVKGGYNDSLTNIIGYNEVLLSLTTSVKSGQSVSVTYTEPSTSNDTLVLKDHNGSDVPSFTIPSVQLVGVSA
jgi:hypothetical protein